MQIISVVNQKGGCGKTITAVNLAAGLSRKNNKVLLIDLDPQAHATFAQGVKSNFTITDLLELTLDQKPLPKEKTIIPISENLSIIPSSLGLASFEHKLISCKDKLQTLTLFIKQLSGFDYVILDCPPNLGVLTLNALVASSYSIIPMLVCDFSLKGVEMLKNILIMVKEFKGTSPTGFYLLSQVDKRSRFAQEFLLRVRKQLGNLLLNTMIRTNIHLREAAAIGKNIFDYKPESRGAEDFMTLTNEIKHVTSDKTSWASLLLKKKNLKEVYIVGDFNSWKKLDTYKLKKVGDDIWSINLLLEKGKYRYKFIAENGWFADPHNTLTENDTFGGHNSLLYI